MRFLLCLALCSCTYTYQHAAARQTKAATYTAWGLDLAGAVGAVVAMDQLAFPLASQPARIASMSALAGAVFLFALSARSGMAPTRAATVEDCIDEWERVHMSATIGRRGDDFASRWPQSLPCEMD